MQDPLFQEEGIYSGVIPMRIIYRREVPEQESYLLTLRMNRAMWCMAATKQKYGNVVQSDHELCFGPPAQLNPLTPVASSDRSAS